MYDKDDRPNRITLLDVIIMSLIGLLVIAAIGAVGYGIYRFVLHWFHLAV